jgi:hypothetical protein
MPDINKHIYLLYSRLNHTYMKICVVSILIFINDPYWEYGSMVEDFIHYFLECCSYSLFQYLVFCVVFCRLSFVLFPFFPFPFGHCVACCRVTVSDWLKMIVAFLLQKAKLLMKYFILLFSYIIKQLTLEFVYMHIYIYVSIF